MNALRLILLGLAVVVFAALGWRLTVWPERSHPATAVGAASPPTAPVPDQTQPAPAPVAAAPVERGPVTAPATADKPATMSDNPPPPVPAQAPPSAPQPSEGARQAVLASLDTAPDLLAVFKAAQAAFPAVAGQSIDTVAAALSHDGGTASPDETIASLMRDLRTTSGVLAARAGPEALSAIFDAKAATLADLQATDPRICADYLFGGSSPEFLDFAMAHRALVARQDLAIIAAMADGRTRQINQDPPTNDEFGLSEADLHGKGLSADEIGALLDGKSLEPPPSDTRLCSNARAYLDAMRDMPAEARDRVYGLAAELLARS